MNLASIPGQTQEGLTTHLARTCEDRGDALAVIDLPDAFQPREDGKEIERLNTQSTITTLINGSEKQRAEHLLRLCLLPMG